jgi:flagellar biosynthesis/type III secretory pathway chaperone
MLSTRLLADLIQRKHDVLVRLCDIGRQQSETVDRGETTMLLQLLAAKQVLITELQQVERELAPFHSENPESRVWPTPTARAQCAQQAAECNQLLQVILEIEKSCADRMTVRRNEVAAQLRHVYAAGQARDAYTAQTART